MAQILFNLIFDSPCPIFLKLFPEADRRNQTPNLGSPDQKETRGTNIIYMFFTQNIWDCVSSQNVLDVQLKKIPLLFV